MSLLNKARTIFVILAIISISYARTFRFKNTCVDPVWVGVLNNPGKELPRNGGFKLEAGQEDSVDTADDWAGRFWGRTGCNFDDSGNGQCATGDCGAKLECAGAGGVPPVSLAEFTLQGDQGQDFFDISLVDGFNLPIAITPDNCAGPVCTVNINENCPVDLQQKDSDGNVVGCFSDCAKTNAPEVCCSADFATPETCSAPPNSGVFEGPCPQAYSWAYDDATSTFTCQGGNYLITFCPSEDATQAGLAPKATATQSGVRRRCMRR